MELPNKHLRGGETNSEGGKTVIAVDLAHGENPKGLTDVTYKNETLTEGMLKVLTDYTFVYFGDAKYEADLGIKNIGDKITYEALKENNVKILIIGQPTSSLYPDEANAVKIWLEEAATSSGLPATPTMATVLISLTSLIASSTSFSLTNLRLDQASVEDPVSNAGGKPYRVVAYADPDKATPK
ncbi:hypothetical protein [Thermococcus sp. JCM 11816]|uniref:hypothetical protein n=1 Tax=Thermococcus sp. (strain JCM 11816 / KS-1) TaxID=1295125 RepID=UPI0006D1A56B